MGLGDATRVNTNLQSLQALKTLQQTNQKLGEHQLRLATGNRINSAEDDSAGYSISKKLEAKTRGQAQALSNIGDAKSMLTVAEGSLTSIMDILQTMKEKAVQAANDTLGDDERAAIETQLQALYEEIGDMLSNTEYNNKPLFAGGTFNFQVEAEQGQSFEYSPSMVQKEDIIAGVSSNGRAATVGTPVETAGGQYDAWTGAITIENNSYTGTHTGSLYFQVDGTDLHVSTADTVAGFGTPLQTVSLTGYTAGTDLTVQGMTISFDEALAALGDGEGFSIDVTAAVAAGADTFVGAIGDHDDAAAIIGFIDQGISTIAEELAKLGDAQNRLTFKQNNLNTSLINNTAARSRISDADFAKEQMEIVKLQILQQTGTASMAQANVAPQAVLSLLGNQ